MECAFSRTVKYVRKQHDIPCPLTLMFLLLSRETVLWYFLPLLWAERVCPPKSPNPYVQT